jgi:hypothetical protein
MANGVRVLLQPELVATAHGQAVTAVRVGLTTLGAGPAQIAKGETKPARLVLSAAFLKKARDEAKAPPAFTEFASIPGTIALSGKPTKVKLTLGGTVNYVNPKPKGNFRRVRLRFEAADFASVPPAPVTPAGAQPPEPHPLHFLTLPEEPAGSRFLVVAVALEIDGSVVAANDANDMLDLPLPPIRIRIVRSDHQFAPSVEKFSIRYVTGGLAGSTVTLEVSSPHYAGGPLFKRFLTDAEIADGSHTLEWDGKCNTKTGDLVGQFLNPLFAPYTLKISDGAGHEQTAPVRVLYHSLELEQGGFTPDDQEPPKTDKTRWVQFKLNELGYYGGPVGHDFDDYLKKAVIRYKANHVKMHEVLHSNYTAAITADLETALAAGDNARVTVSGDAFTKPTGKSKIFVEALTYEELAGGGSEFGTPKPPKEKARLNRPLIPILAKIFLRGKKGKKVDAPAAVGPVRVDWLFIDVREDLKRQLSAKPGQPSRTRQYVELALKTRGGRTATVGDNCHQDFAGIRGTNDYKSAFVLGNAYEPYDVKDDAGQKVCFSVAVTDAAKFPRRLGKAGVYFRPSFVAGDSYQLRADLDFTGLPNQADLEKLHGVTSRSKRVSGRTGVFEIVRRAKVALQLTWPARKNDPEWQRVREEFSHAYVDLDVSGIVKQPISAFLTQKEYRDIVVANTAHTDPTKVSLLPNALVGVTLPAQGALNAGAYKLALNTFTNADFWDRIYEPLRRKLTEKIRKVYPTGFVVVEFMTHVPVDIQNAPPADTTVTKANRQFVTWSFSIGLPDSQVFADQMDPDKVYYVVAHEMGHNFFLLHWENAGGVAADHDTSDHNCSMSYSSSGGPFAHQRPGKYTPHFCGKCILKLRGWDINAAGIPAHS